MKDSVAEARPIVDEESTIHTHRERERESERYIYIDTEDLCYIAW